MKSDGLSKKITPILTDKSYESHEPKKHKKAYKFTKTEELKPESNKKSKKLNVNNKCEKK